MLLLTLFFIVISSSHLFFNFACLDVTERKFKVHQISKDNTRKISKCGEQLKRYTLYKDKWKIKNLTYEITKYSDRLNRKMVDNEISRAFRVWTSVIPINIIKKNSNSLKDADIIIRFETDDHGDKNPFNKSGLILAHTYYPAILSNGNQKSFIHFNDEEEWTAYSKTGINLFQVALHEIGHSLGLKHSNKTKSVMWPGYRGYKPKLGLHLDDIQGIQKLYGPRN